MRPTSGSMWLPPRACATMNKVAPARADDLAFASAAARFDLAADVLACGLAALAFFDGLPLVCAASASDDKTSSATTSIARRRQWQTFIACSSFSNGFARQIVGAAS